MSTNTNSKKKKNNYNNSSFIDETTSLERIDINEKPVKRKPASSNSDEAGNKSRSKKKSASKKKAEKSTGIKTIISRVFLFIGITLLIIIIFLIGLVFILLKGPSKDASKIFALSCHETSALKWLPSLFLSKEEYDAILSPKTEEAIMIADESKNEEFKELPMAKKINTDGNDDDSPAATSEYTEAIEIIDIKGPTYKGKLMLVHDPSKVIIASIDSFGGTGLTLSAFLNKYDAIGCTNAGGFVDEGGTGKGGIPDGIVIKDGTIVYGSAGGSYSGFAGFDAEHKLHVGNYTGQQALNMGIVTGTNFKGGPVLILDGVRQSNFVSGINPRTAVGQTEDGTVILLAIEGRLADSLGATFDDLADIMEEYGAINAVNMDGGSSSGIYYEGERLTRSSSVIGDRPLPTAILVLR